LRTPKRSSKGIQGNFYECFSSALRRHDSNAFFQSTQSETHSIPNFRVRILAIKTKSLELEHQLEVKIKRRTVEGEERKTEFESRNETAPSFDSLVQAKMALAIA